MKDRALRRSICEMCFEPHFLDSLIRLQIEDPQRHTDVVNAVLCQSCKDYAVSWWWDADPTLHRYYHPA